MEFKRMVLMSLLTTLSEANYYLGTSAIGCKLAQPILIFQNGTIITDIPGLNVTYDESIGVGYVQKMAAYEYIGCQRIIDSRFNMVIEAMEDPGSCLHFCENVHFGISGNKCYCLVNYTDSIILTPEKCTKKCTQNTGIACGKEGTYISIYRMNSGVNATTQPTVAGNCLRLNPNKKNHTAWKNCIESLSYRSLCSTGSHVHSPREFTEVFTDAANVCFNYQSTLTTYNNSKLGNTNIDELWTGVVRAESIFNITDLPKESGLSLGSIKIKGTNGSILVLDFSTNPTDITKYLCRLEQAMNGTTRANTDSSVPSTSLLHEISTTFELTGSSAISNDHGLPKERKQSADVGVPVGVSVAVAVIIIVAVTLLVVVKWRRKKTLNNEMEPKTNNVMKEKPNEYSDIPEIKHINGNSPLRYSKVEEANNYDHTYHVLEGDRKTDSESSTTNKKTPLTESDYNYPDMTGFIQEKAKSQPSDIDNGQYAHTYFVLEEHQKDVDTVDGTYNVTGAHKPKTDLETDNVYNKLEHKNVATYDHIPGSVGSGNKYSSKKNATKMLKPSEEPDSVYNHISAVEENVTYHHANILPNVDKNP